MSTSIDNNSTLVKHGDKPLTLLGKQVCAGEQAADFKAQCDRGGDFCLSELRGRTVILSVFPSINTPVCQLQTKQFNQRATQLGESVVVVSVSRDTLADYKKFCAAEGIDSLVNLSDLAYEDFGTRYGFLLEDPSLLARGIVVINPEGVISHVEYVHELTDEPDYEAALTAARATASEDAFVQLPLAYPLDALAPAISEMTMSFHYGKHLLAYITNLNALIKGTEYEGKDLVSIVRSSEGGIFNNAGQLYNHRLYFGNFAPAAQAQKQPTGALLTAIESTWGSVDAFKEAFEKAGVAQFGSGWVWLSSDAEGKLSVSSTANGDSPLTQGLTPLHGIDVWEHAYYLDYQNLRAASIKACWDILDWKKVESRYAAIIQA